MNRRTLGFVLGGLLIAAAITITTTMVVWRMAKRTVMEEILAPQEKTVDVAALITQVKELNRLETASMRVMHVGTITQSYKMVPNAIAGDEITFLATGDVIAGIDLSKIQKDDVWRSPDGTINLRLPAPEVLVTRVDNAKSRVLTRKTGMLRRGDVDLETRARQHAEANIRNEAIRNGVLRVAEETGEKKLAGFLNTLGFQKVNFVNTKISPESLR
ncbi:MAG TPA: DUF4230 domain-containing protein [Thermoanaerobaculia bacterium]|nr:DUF4230 domain-containing protein [Thermoanaerobaculia bacterium]